MYINMNKLAITFTISFSIKKIKLYGTPEVPTKVKTWKITWGVGYGEMSQVLFPFQKIPKVGL